MIVSAENRARLAAIIGDGSRPLKHVQRANIVLHTADRLPALEVARRAEVSRPAVWRWQRRYAEGAFERLTLLRLYEELRGLGYAGGYDAVRRYARAWRRSRGSATAVAYVSLSFGPGEAYQFDWSHEIVLINGTTVTAKVAHLRLCHSRMLFARADPREPQETVFDAHEVFTAAQQRLAERDPRKNLTHPRTASSPLLLASLVVWIASPSSARMPNSVSPGSNG